MGIFNHRIEIVSFTDKQIQVAPYTRKVKVGNDQEVAQSEISIPKTEPGKQNKIDNQVLRNIS